MEVSNQKQVAVPSVIGTEEQKANFIQAGEAYAAQKAE